MPPCITTMCAFVGPFSQASGSYSDRSIAYLDNDSGEFDPDCSLTWGDITCRKDGELIPLHRIAEATQISVRVYSRKSSLETCTSCRSLELVPGSDVCVVTALAAVYAAYRHTFKHHPRAGDAVFEKDAKASITGKEVSGLLKLAAAGSGIPHGRVVSHSLRRGGATQFVASGLSDEAIIG